MRPYQIPEIRDRRRRLGRNIHHDPRSLLFQVAGLPALHQTTTRLRRVPVFTQTVGSCTAQATMGALGSDGLYESAAPVMAERGWAWSEAFTEGVLYHLTTQTDSFPGEWPPSDSGSDGLSVSKQVKAMGLTSGYLHATSTDAVLTGLQAVSGIMGANWYTDMDTPDADRVVRLGASARVRGGHEFQILNVDMERELVEAVNSWGPVWGVGGHFFLPFTLVDRLLGENGDVTFNVPLTSPAPVPVPEGILES